MTNKYLTHVKPRFPEIQKWVRDGVSDKDVAKNLNVAYSTFREYAKKHKELKEIMLLGKTAANAIIENALFKTAKGYEYEEIKIKKEPRLIEDGTTVTMVTEKTITKKHVQPNVSAQQFWLKNKDPLNWHDRFENNVSGGLDLVYVEEDLIKKIIAENGNE